MTSVLIDTHVHIYKRFDLERVFATTESRSRSLAGSECKRAILFLVDRNGHEAFPDLRESARNEVAVETYRFRKQTHPETVEVSKGDFTISILQGRQWASAERIEVLGIGTNLNLPDGEPAESIIAAISASGGLPILPWSFGKWTGLRRNSVIALMSKFSPGELCFGDITLRAVSHPNNLLTEAYKRGFSVLAGSDPLPLPGEEQMICSYGVVAERCANQDPRYIVEILRKPGSDWRIVGSRQHLVAAASRWARLRAGIK